MIEVLVALTILGLVLGALLQVFSGGLRNVATAEQYVLAAVIADSKLAAVGREIPLEPGAESSGEEGRYAWTVEIAPYEPGEDAKPNKDAVLQLYQVAVSVRWSSVRGERVVSVDTLMNGVIP